MIKIGNKEVGNGKTYIVAEFGVNHNGSLKRAVEGIKEAARAGADAIKFQTYTADELVCKNTPKFWEFEDDDDKDQHDAYEGLGGEPREWYPKLMKVCEEEGIEFLTTCFSEETADYFNELGMKAFKIASSDMSTLPYLRHIARFQKPIILSTGASTMTEIREAVKTILNEGNDQIIVLHCMLAYPTMYGDRDVHYEDGNFNVINRLIVEFPELEVGISDHTQTAFSSIIAAAMGADLIEKHYTTDKTLGKSADHWFSVDPKELKEIVDGCRNMELLSGSWERPVFECEAESRKYDKRSLVLKRPVTKGSTIEEDNITWKRPGTGIWPNELTKVIGAKAEQNIKENTPITWEMISTI